ncbi:1,5-anhydro-D-fructose reductase [bacterium HR36]|nr:1,5-anhydro-D-fructose reductase [bacterium HR36]
MIAALTNTGEIMVETIGLGVIGCGNFGLFALQHFTQVEGVALKAMAATHRPQAIACARRFGIGEPVEVDNLLARPDIQLVYIATPPYLHYPYAKQALLAGKHVVVEKPLALRLEDAQELLQLARQQGRLLITNLMQRYNPVFDKVSQLLTEKPLGELLHASFENYAADEGLPPEHWFWDREKSGGIFVEHGVHFFDLFAGWLGRGQVVAAARSLRPGSGVEEQVECIVRYQGHVLVHFYHGFHQLGRMDRQELRLVFELGDVMLQEWIPTRVEVRAALDEEQTRILCGIFPRAVLDVIAVYAAKDRQACSRFRPRDIYQSIALHWGWEAHKMQRYGQLLRDLLADQLAYLRDPRHVRRITEQNGYDSLQMAIAADQLAQATTL